MTFLTIKGEAKLGIVPEHYLRAMLKRGELPGFYSGNRFYVHHEALIEKLTEECRKNASN